MNIKIFFLFFLLVLPIAYAQGDNQISIYNISKCYGEAQVKVRADNITVTDFELNSCYRKNTGYDMWLCKCDNNAGKNIALKYYTKNYAKFDFTIQYNLNYENETISSAQINKRTTNVNNIEINKDALVSKKKKATLPSTEGLGKIIKVAGIMFVVIILIIFIIFKKLFNSETNDLDDLTDKEKSFNNELKIFLDK